MWSTSGGSIIQTVSDVESKKDSWLHLTSLLVSTTYLGNLKVLRLLDTTGIFVQTNELNRCTILSLVSHDRAC